MEIIAFYKICMSELYDKKTQIIFGVICFCKEGKSVTKGLVNPLLKNQMIQLLQLLNKKFW